MKEILLGDVLSATSKQLLTRWLIDNKTLPGNRMRQGDLLQLSWSAYDGSHIRLQQSKTGRRLTMPVGRPLKMLLDGTERRGPIILTNTTATLGHG
jgi:integrase